MVGRTSDDSDSYAYQNDHNGHILVHFDGHPRDNFASPGTTEHQTSWGNDTQVTARRATSKHNSKSFGSRVTRQKSRRRELLGRQAKLDTSFTRHRGSVPHQVFPEDDLRGNSSRKHNWFAVGRSSTKNKGLGITKGTPQPNAMHRGSHNNDPNEPRTADSLAPGTKEWEEISPWDRPIPIGMSVPTDSVSDFGPYKVPRQRSGSNTTLVTPNIVITPAMPMQSVWSPDTPYTESDYTASVYSRNTFNGHNFNTDAPPVPALPANYPKTTNTQEGMSTRQQTSDPSKHNRNDTSDSSGTAFEDFDESQRKDRVMSSDTFFEEDETPLRERVVETSLAVDTSLTPTARRSQGWWNVITTPFVTTPLTGTWPKNDRNGNQTPEIPQVPAHYDSSRSMPASPTVNNWTKTEQGPITNVNVSFPMSSLPAVDNNPDAHHHEQARSTVASDQTVNGMMGSPANGSSGNAEQSHPQPTRAIPIVNVISPQSSTTASPPVTNTVTANSFEPRQVQEQARPININIELQDRRPDINVQLVNAGSQPTAQQAHTSWPVPQLQSNVSSMSGSSHAQPLPVFAPPPTTAQKGSHFSYDNGSFSKSTPDLKGQKKHRKVSKMAGFFRCNKRRQQTNADETRTDEKKKKKKRSCFLWCCGCCLILVVFLAILIPILVVFTKKKDDVPTSISTGTQPGGEVNSGWLNLTNYPPIPTGVLTIAQPEAVVEQSGCVAPTTLWSCALPKELQQSVKPNKPDQPNFKIEITFDNSTATPSKTRRVANPVSAGAFIRSRFLQARAAPMPSPAPPTDEDMEFLGRTTDGNDAPFQGEDTPLFITIQDPKDMASRLAKRAGPEDPTNITAGIPPPMLNRDGTAAPANLVPMPSAQPLRLYNRGKDDEHYGFYTYYDRSIFLKQINGTNRGGNPADTDGGSTVDAAAMRCTFSETRFLVQIWTRSEASKPLLQGAQSGTSSRRPGTFPYPVSVTIDRHGGNPARKNLYCYDMESDGTIQNKASKRSFQFEDRAFGGNLVNGTQGRPNVTGPVDGGSGGCRCQYQNWLL
jgi:hypothetical protein